MRARPYCSPVARSLWPVACLWPVAFLAALSVGCGSQTTKADRESSEPVKATRAEPLFPGDGDRFAPALSQVDGEADRLGETLADVATCGRCHQDAFAQQQASAHAFSSFNNPIYRASIDPMREGVGNRPSRMCAGCHDLALLVDGAIDAEVRPDDLRAHAGVTCRTCHGIRAVTRDGNGSWTLAAAGIFVPDADADADEASIVRHRRSARPIRTVELCGSCHRAFLSEATGNESFLTGQDDLTPFSSSPYNGSGLARIDDELPRKTCIGCHMPPEDAPLGDVAAHGGSIASHRFPGAHTWLASMLDDETQLSRQRQFLRGVASVDIAAARDARGVQTLPADGAPVVAGSSIELDVVIRNRLVGHRFPGGVMDAQDTWVDVVVTDADGARIAASGDDPHRLAALVAGPDGVPRHRREVHEFRAPIINHTIPPRDAIVARYAFAVPDGVAQPLEVHARLLHRTRNQPLQDAACAAARSPRGQAFSRRARALGDPVLDPCAPQPITEISSAVIWLGKGARPRSEGSDARPTWSRLYEHGMALLHSVQERVGEARPSLMAALELLPDIEDTARERAMVLAALAKLEARQGRTEHALERLDEASQLIGPHPALAKIRGDALSSVWRWDQAADALAVAVAGAPDNLSGWQAYAIALGSRSRDAEALDAAVAGLARSPRDAALLRVQAVSLRALGRAAQATTALNAYDRHRPPDRATDLRVQCAAQSEHCARERDPIHTHWMK